jgi:hypothetical protein
MVQIFCSTSKEDFTNKQVIAGDKFLLLKKHGKSSPFLRKENQILYFSSRYRKSSLSTALTENFQKGRCDVIISSEEAKITQMITLHQQQH